MLREEKSRGTRALRRFVTLLPGEIERRGGLRRITFAPPSPRLPPQINVADQHNVQTDAKQKQPIRKASAFIVSQVLIAGWPTTTNDDEPARFCCR
jgi:hypothetical protein